MAFTTQELYRIKRELGYHVIGIGSLPYIQYTQLFDSVINVYVDAEVSTTATLATAISASSSAAPQAITLASATGFSAGQRAVLDVDDRTETATIQSLAGAVMTVQLRLAHSGTIPVALEGPITMARELLRQIERARAEMASVFGDGALKKVDEVEFYKQGDMSRFGLIGAQVTYWRDELASVLGVANGWRHRNGGAGGGSVSCSVY
jgi:hypothetical protein